MQEFVTEAASMASCRHRHIVAPKGWHASERHCILVYEYAPNGSLDDHLFAPKAGSIRQTEKRIFLSWPQRLQIAIGTAKGLAYLHEVNSLERTLKEKKHGHLDFEDAACMVSFR